MSDVVSNYCGGSGIQVNELADTQAKKATKGGIVERTTLNRDFAGLGYQKAHEKWQQL